MSKLRFTFSPRDEDMLYPISFPSRGCIFNEFLRYAERATRIGSGRLPAGQLELGGNEVIVKDGWREVKKSFVREIFRFGKIRLFVELFYRIKLPTKNVSVRFVIKVVGSLRLLYWWL
jgi:hypothetical protein